MSSPLHVLILEDQPDDAELMMIVLRQQGFVVDYERVESEKEYLARLTSDVDLILADYSLPQFSALSALHRMKEQELDIPFIVVTGTASEEATVQCMKEGAADYLLKDRLARLGQAVTNALEAKRLRDEKRQMESALRRNEKRFRTLIENSADGILLIDPNGIVLYESPGVTRIGGYSAEARRGRDVIEWLDPEMQPSLRKLLSQLLQNPGETITAQFRLQHEDGSWRLIDATAINMLNEPGVAAIVVNFRDITQRKEAEEALEQERNLLHILIDNIPDYIFITDTESRFIIANLAQARLLGVKTPQELVGKTDLDFLPKHLAQEYFADEQAIIRSGVPLINQEGPAINFVTGQSTWNLTTKIPFRDAQGTIQGLVGISRDITERKRAEDELRKVTRAVEQSPNIVLITDLQGNVEYVNPRFTKVTGYAPGEVIGKNPRLLKSGETSLGTYQHLWDTIVSGGEWRGELHNKKRNGETYWASVTISPITDSQGQITHFLGIQEDITTRKELDEALRKSEHAERENRIFAEALRDITAALVSILSPEIVMARILETIGPVVPHDAADIMVLEGKIVRVAYSHGWASENVALSGVHQFELDSVPSFVRMVISGAPCLIPDISNNPEWKDLGILRDPPIRSYVGAPIKAHNQTIGFLNLNSTMPGFFTSEHAERLMAFANYAAIAIENAQLYDEIRRYAGNLERHVEERTAELQQVKDRIEAIFNSSSDAIIVAGIDGSIQQVNPAFTELFSIAEEDTRGQTISIFIHDDYLDTFKKELQSIRSDYQRKRSEFVARRKDGAQFNAEASLSPIIVRNRKTLEVEAFDVVCIVRDITERKRFEKELQDLNQLKTEFLSTAAHELRTPLTSIRGFSEILLTRTLDLERQRKYITMINEQSTQLGQLIDDLLDISRLEAKRSLTLVLQSINVSELLDKVLIPFRESSPKHRITKEDLPSCPPVIGDAVRISQVMKNLISNAIKYSPDGGSVIIQLREVTHYLQVSVQDEGIGMTPEQLVHLFEKFYRANASNTAISGTGLGLAISKLIVEMHGGEIWAESKYGVGTTISFTLPLAR